MKHAQMESVIREGSMGHIPDFQWGKCAKNPPRGHTTSPTAAPGMSKERKRLTLEFLLFIHKGPNSPPLAVQFGP